MKVFNENPWPEVVVKKRLAQQLGIKVKGVSSWFERTRFKKGVVKRIFKEEQAQPEPPPSFPEFPKFPNNSDNQGGIVSNLRSRTTALFKQYQGVDLRLLESIFFLEKTPDSKWIEKIAQFTQSSQQEVAQWFMVRNKKLME